MLKCTAIIVVVFLLAGCAFAQLDQGPSAPSLAESHEYRIRAGDQLSIKFFYQPELNDDVIIRPDGHVSLQLVRDVKAEGMTIPDFEKLLTETYSHELQAPQISVILRATGARIYVDGEVNRAGPLVFLERMNVLQAVSAAGGLRDTARTDQVLVIRPNGDAAPTVFAVNYKKALKGELAELSMLRPSDIVVVPRSRVSNVNSWVDRYLKRNVPIPVSLGWIP
jgi:polysaccharide biosynthesis/export protein